MKRRKSTKPPRIAETILRLCFRCNRQESILRDLKESYAMIAEDGGAFRANVWYISQVLKIIKGKLFNKLYWSAPMFYNYFKVAIRNMKRHKGYSFINIAGLAIGMTCCLLIMLWIFDELSFDRFHENAPYLYKVEQDYFRSSGEIFHVYPTPYPMGPCFKEEVPEIREQARYKDMGNVLLNYGDKDFFENGVRAVDPSFLQILTYPLILGNQETVLNDPHAIVVSEAIAEKYFGSEDPVGKMVTINHDFAFTVMGVFRNVPTNSWLQFDILVNFKITKEMGLYHDDWGYNYVTTLVLVREDASIPEVNRKITDIRHRRAVESASDPETLNRITSHPKAQVMLIPLTDIYLRRYSNTGETTGAILYVYVFSIIALVVLSIACINFTNLATARAEGRSKEVGLRKVVGAARMALIRQFYGESILQAFLALICACLLTVILLPSFNTLVEKRFLLEDLLRTRFIVGMIAIPLITGVFAGTYPALFLSAFQPVLVLKRTLSGGVKGAHFRKVLVLIQFTLSIFLIIGTGIVYKQMRYIQNRKLGYDKEHVIYIPLRGDTAGSYRVLKEALKGKPDILNVSGSMGWPASVGASAGDADWEGKDPEFDPIVYINRVDFDYTETMKIEMVEGRPFSKMYTTDASNGILINEELRRIMDKASVFNEHFRFWDVEGHIVGVMKNYHFQSLHNVIKPLAVCLNPDNINYAIIRLASGDITSGIQTVQSEWERTIPNYPFEYHFLDEAVESMYQNEKTIGTLLRVFTVLAVLIACLGLFGLASFTAEQRTKEIGIRKVLGASVPYIMILLYKEFAKWVLIANVVAWPIAYFILNNWLNNFSYRMNLRIDIFILSGLLAFGIAILTVSFQSIKAASANPVEALKYE